MKENSKNSESQLTKICKEFDENIGLKHTASKLYYAISLKLDDDTHAEENMIANYVDIRDLVNLLDAIGEQLLYKNNNGIETMVMEFEKERGIGEYIIALSKAYFSSLISSLTKKEFRKLAEILGGVIEFLDDLRGEIPVCIDNLNLGDCTIIQFEKTEVERLKNNAEEGSQDWHYFSKLLTLIEE